MAPWPRFEQLAIRHAMSVMPAALRDGTLPYSRCDRAGGRRHDAHWTKSVQ